MASLNPEESLIIEHILIEDEGVRNFPYLDCCGLPWRQCNCHNKGKLTIGIGRNLDDVGLSKSEIWQLKENDVKKVVSELDLSFDWFQTLSTARRIVIISMAFNLGVQGLKNFKNMIKAIEQGDFDSASEEMKDSAWFLQVKDRGKRLASIMKSGHI